MKTRLQVSGDGTNGARNYKALGIRGTVAVIASEVREDFDPYHHIFFARSFDSSHLQDLLFYYFYDQYLHTFTDCLTV